MVPTDQSQKELGILTALVGRFERERLPQALEIKERVGKGEKLSDADLAFLQRVMSDVQDNKHLIDNHPEYQKLVAQVIGLYNEITELAVKNEEAD